MSEADYWVSLEFRVCREFAGMEECRKLGLWCDGITPYGYAFELDRPVVTGSAWIGVRRSMDEWSMTLVPPGQPGARFGVDWDSLLPPDGVTGWLTVDLEGQHIEIEP